MYVSNDIIKIEHLLLRQQYFFSVCKVVTNSAFSAYIKNKFKTFGNLLLLHDSKKHLKCWYLHHLLMNRYISITLSIRTVLYLLIFAILFIV